MRPRAHIFLALLLLAAPTAVFAIEQVAVSLGNIAGNGWSAERVELVTDAVFSPESGGRLRIARLILSGPGFTLFDLAVDCRSLALTGSQLSCADGTLEVGQFLDRRLEGQISIDYALTGDLSVVARLDPFAGGRLALEVTRDAGELAVRVRGTGMDSVALRALAANVTDIPGFHLAGAVDIDLSYMPGSEGDELVRLSVSGRAIEFANDAGTRAGENINLALNGEATRIATGWRLNTQASLQQGLVYIDPVYLDAGERGADLRLDGNWHSGRSEFRVARLDFNHKNVLKGFASGSARFAPAFAVADYDVTVETARFPGAYETYLQPWVYGTLLGDLATGGQFNGRITGAGSQLRSLDLHLDAVDLEDRRGRFSLSALTGSAGWADDEQLRSADLAWQSGSLYRIALGATRLPLRIGRDSVALREPAYIAVLDGALEVDAWQLARPGRPDMEWSFDGVLTPISLEDISAALDWPPFTGKLSGVIPAVRYEKQKLTVGGVLLVRVFDGELTVSELALEQPFGLVPRMSADVTLKDLDLERATSAFSFGKIEGRLGGKIDNLRLVNWQPVAFDAVVATPPGDESRHRISQKAIDDISSIGGGRVRDALSNTIIGFFEEFPYDRLGISCRLENGVCEMGGVAPAPPGYYIVKGRVLPPRIDIIGFSDRVDWETLLARVKAAISSGGVSIQ